MDDGCDRDAGTGTDCDGDPGGADSGGDWGVLARRVSGSGPDKRAYKGARPPEQRAHVSYVPADPRRALASPEQRSHGPQPPDDAPESRPQVPPAREVSDREQAGPPDRIENPDFRDYVRARSPALHRTAYLLTGNLADAEDLVQSALAKTYLAWDRIENRSAIDGYVRRAMVNTHISWWRRRRVEEFPTDEIPEQPVADQAVSSDMQETLRRAIDRLPQRMRAAIMLRYYDDMTEAEVAEVLGVSLGTVKSTVSRAVAKLRIDAELRPE